jgi:hypothetical protein
VVKGVRHPRVVQEQHKGVQLVHWVQVEEMVITPVAVVVDTMAVVPVTLAVAAAAVQVFLMQQRLL